MSRAREEQPPCHDPGVGTQWRRHFLRLFLGPSGSLQRAIHRANHEPRPSLPGAVWQQHRAAVRVQDLAACEHARENLRPGHRDQQAEPGECGNGRECSSGYGGYGCGYGRI